MVGFIRIALILFFVSGSALAQNRPGENTAPPHRVLIISVDGLRPDLLLRADTPVIHKLLERASFTMWARTTAVSVTMPSHTSMLTGVIPQKHQIEWNHDLPLAAPVYPAYPTLFELAHRAGYSTGMVAGKSKFGVLNKPGTIDQVFVPDREVITDEQVTAEALKMIEAGPPQVLFIHLPETDTVGHASGWATPKQLATIAGADADIGRILAALQAKGLADQTLIIISADHGGAGKSHGADDPRSRHIPWIALGPGVRQGLDLTTYADLEVRTEDTFATACYWLKVTPSRDIDGKPVERIFDRTGQELLNPVPATQASAP